LADFMATGGMDSATLLTRSRSGSAGSHRRARRAARAGLGYQGGSQIYGFAAYTLQGGLMSYGPNVTEMAGQVADYVDKILKGARPGDLPIYRPNRFHLVTNLKTAKALGLTIPPSLLQRADQVIE
jgi:putative ABC transport system substrate-binding protein